MDLREQYTQLPESIKAEISFREFQWMDADRRGDLVAEMTEPDPEADY